MNERIKELLAKAGIYQPERFDGIDGSNQLEKFAELIVKDCRDMFMVDSVSWNLLNEKLEHFGVEE